MNMKHFFRLALVALLAACSSGIKVYYDYDKAADFGAAKTFAFLPWNDEYSKIISELNKRRILEDITEEMTKRGITKVESTTEADLTVHRLHRLLQPWWFLLRQARMGLRLWLRLWHRHHPVFRNTLCRGHHGD